MTAGRIQYVTVGWNVDTDDGPQMTVISLADFRWHCRRERVDDLIDDLVVLCEDVQGGRDRVAAR
jgi:hypothetical protein